MGGSSWLTAWTDYNAKANFTAGDPEDLWKWLGGYAGFGAAQCKHVQYYRIEDCNVTMFLAITILANNYIQATATIAAAAMIHKNLLTNIMKVPSHFFDTTPMGRVVNRFSKVTKHYFIIFSYHFPL